MRGPIPDKPADRPKTPHVARLADAYYGLRDENACGGSLHIVLDDTNLADHHIAYCRDFARERGDREGEHLATLLLQMTPTQRREVRKQMQHGMFEAEAVAVWEDELNSLPR